MGKKIYRSVKIENVPWVRSTMKPRKLPRTVFIGLNLELDLIATTTGTPALTREEFAKAIEKITILSSGQDHRVVIPFYHTFFSNWHDFSKEPEYSFDLTAAGSNKVMRMTCYLPFALTRAAIPEDTIFDTRAMDTHLEVQWGPAALNSTVTITSGSLNLTSEEYDPIDALGQLARLEMSTSSDVLSKIGQVEHKLDVGGNNQYKRLFVYVRDNTGALSDTQLDHFIVRARSYHYLNKSARAIKAENARTYAISPQTGVYIIDFTKFGKMTRRLMAQNLGELILEVNSLVTDGTIDVVKEKAIYKVVK